MKATILEHIIVFILWPVVGNILLWLATRLVYSITAQLERESTCNQTSP